MISNLSITDDNVENGKASSDENADTLDDDSAIGSDDRDGDPSSEDTDDRDDVAGSDDRAEQGVFSA